MEDAEAEYALQLGRVYKQSSKLLPQRRLHVTYPSTQGHVRDLGMIPDEKGLNVECSERRCCLSLFCETVSSELGRCSTPAKVFCVEADRL